MTGFWRGEENEIVRLRLTPTVWEPWHIESLEQAAALAAARHAVHLKVDTGMGRLGVALAELPAVLKALRAAPHLDSRRTLDSPCFFRNYGCAFGG